MLNCDRCGLTNRPYAVACPHCGRPLQAEAAAAAKQLEWDALPLELRLEQEREFDRRRERHEEHRRWLRRHRWTQAVLGALLVNTTLGGSTFFAVPWSIPVDLALGAAAGLCLNALRGGAYYGLALFGVAAVLSTTLRLFLAGITQSSEEATMILVPFAFLASLLGGYFMGLRMDFEHLERSIIG